MKINIRQPLAFSEIGCKDRQEDCFFPTLKDLTTENRCFVLCDGLGGREGGEVASDAVCSALGGYLESYLGSNKRITTGDFEQALGRAYDELDNRDARALKKMGTTMTCLCLHKDGYLAAHIGDSRIYHVRPADSDFANGQLGIVYQSSDHSLVNDLLKAGKLTEEEVADFPQRNIVTRAMLSFQMRRCKADIYMSSDIKPGDYFFLCSDGILEQLSNRELCGILASSATDKEKLENIKLVCCGKTKDNFTCMLVPVNDVAGKVKMREKNSVRSVTQKTRWRALPIFIAFLFLLVLVVGLLMLL